MFTLYAVTYNAIFFEIIVFYVLVQAAIIDDFISPSFPQAGAYSAPYNSNGYAFATNFAAVDFFETPKTS